MFNTLSDFLQIWEKESKITQQLLEVLTDESLQQKVATDDRTLGRLAWHIVITISEMMTKTGLVFTGVDEESPVPSSAQVILKSYTEVSNAMVNAIKGQWNDHTLQEERDMYGERWTIETTLHVLISHQIHHRGQMTVLMRQAGLRVPGIYGPSREEWSQYGMDAPEV